MGENRIEVEPQELEAHGRHGPLAFNVFIDMIYPLVNSHITMEKSTIFIGRTYKQVWPFSIDICNKLQKGREA